MMLGPSYRQSIVLSMFGLYLCLCRTFPTPPPFFLDHLGWELLTQSPKSFFECLYMKLFVLFLILALYSVKQRVSVSLFFPIQENPLSENISAVKRKNPNFQRLLKLKDYITLQNCILIHDHTRNLLPDSFKARGGSGVKKTSLAYIKVQPVMELLLFTELQNLRL